MSVGCQWSHHVLADEMPETLFDFYSPKKPIYTRARFLPSSELHDAHLNNVLLTDGCRIHGATIHNSVVGLRSIIKSGVSIQSSIVMGGDYFETDGDLAENKQLGRPAMGIGEGTVIEGAIIDKNARIGRNVRIRALPNRPESPN